MKDLRGDLEKYIWQQDRKVPLELWNIKTLNICFPFCPMQILNIISCWIKKWWQMNILLLLCAESAKWRQHRDITYYKMKIAFKNPLIFLSVFRTTRNCIVCIVFHCIYEVKWESLIITWTSRPHGFSLTEKSFGRSKYTSSDIFTIEYLVQSAAAATCMHTSSTGYSLLFHISTSSNWFMYVLWLCMISMYFLMSNQPA